MNNIEKAKHSFEASFASGTFYNRQTQDKQHLSRILNALEPTDNKKILDLGTGSGYLAFAIAKSSPLAFVTGLDIVEDTLKANTRQASQDELENIEFTAYGGIQLPFKNNTYDTVVTRYALHHFPDIQTTFNEIARILKPGGKLLISDPTPNTLDQDRFVDRFMQLKDDGHIRFYTLDEFTAYAQEAGLQFDSMFQSTIRFPRIADEQYSALLEHTPDIIKEAYDISIHRNECWITENVLNITFTKNA